LSMRDVVGKMRLNPISQRFDNNFIYDIAQTYGSKILRDGRIRFLRNEGDISLIKISR
jgi:hypothetical protein